MDGHSPNIPPSIAVDEPYNRLGAATGNLAGKADRQNTGLNLAH
jgi:hypothetical protein